MENRLRQSARSDGTLPDGDGLPEQEGQPAPPNGPGTAAPLAKGQHSRVIHVIKAALLGAIQVRGVIDQARDLARQAQAMPPSALEARAALAADFDMLRLHIDQVVEEASYAGSNLLAGRPAVPDDDRRVTHGLLVVLDGLPDNGPLIRYHDLRAGPDGLGLEPARNGWADADDIDWAVHQLDIAHWHVQQSGAELAVSLRILEPSVRPAGTESDNSEGDGAGLILQVRNQLAGTSHGLATPAQKGILRLF